MKRIILLSVFLLFISFCSAQNLDDKLPIDPNVSIGKLQNGIKYLIRYNKKPEKRAELRLVVDAGSVLEDDDQQGLAHLSEHMAFNGTENFKKLELVNYLESVGMRFGPDLNAYTSFDETVYILTIPTDSPSIVSKAFQILEDWAHGVSFDGEEIDKERGVVIEEWRLGRGAEMRMLDKQLPILFKDSRYAVRLTIGKKEILESFPHDRLRQYYHDWYRPELMAVIAVGDFDKNEIENLIKKHFSKIVSPSSPRTRTLYPVPDHQEPLFAIATDPEATIARVSINYKREVRRITTTAEYQHIILEQLYNSMLNNRLNELTKQPDPPFIFGFSSSGKFVRTKYVYSLGSAVKENGIERGLETLLTEAERIKRFGFTQTELDREKKDMLRSMEQAYNEREKTESRAFVSEYVRHFLDDEPIPGIEMEYELYKKYIPKITLDEVNQLASDFITDKNRVLMVNAPEKQSVKIPGEKELMQILETVNKKEIKPYVDKVSDEPLVSAVPTPATLTEQRDLSEIAVTQWKLSNGVCVVLKPTDFKNDEILFTSYSPGGNSLIDDKDYIAATTASTVIQEGGLSKYDQITLQKMLQGKIVSVSPYIGELEEGLSGNSAPSDLETMFQLIYLYVTAPRIDSATYLAYQSRIRGILQNRSARPESAFEDTIQVTMAQYHPRRRPWTETTLDEMNLHKSFTFYKDRFSDASDFTFFIVGNFKLDEIKPLVLTYLGGLPSKQRKEQWRDIGIKPPKGVIAKTIKKGLEPKSQVRIIFSGPFNWSRENRHAIQSMVSVLRIKLREVMREEKGGVYGVGVSASTWQYPTKEYRLTISFGCAPERVDELVNTAIEQIDSFKNYGTTDIYITKVKEMQRREREVNLKENRFWLNSLQFYYSNQESPLDILKYDDLVESVSKNLVQKTAQQYFIDTNFVKVVLLPQEK